MIDGRGKHPNSKKKLKPLNKIDSETAKKIRSMGGKASQEKIKEEKAKKSACDMFINRTFNEDIPKDLKSNLKSLGITDIDEITFFEVVIEKYKRMVMGKGASIRDLKDFIDFIIECSGSKPNKEQILKIEQPLEIDMQKIKEVNEKIDRA